MKGMRHRGLCGAPSAVQQLCRFAPLPPVSRAAPYLLLRTPAARAAAAAVAAVSARRPRGRPVGARGVALGRAVDGAQQALLGRGESHELHVGLQRVLSRAPGPSQAEGGRPKETGAPPPQAPPSQGGGGLGGIKAESVRRLALHAEAGQALVVRGISSGRSQSKKSHDYR